MAIKVGIFFGGPSREREVSFAGGRTVYDNLDKRIFDPVPIFVDSFGNLIRLKWPYIYKGTIRDFYPSSQFFPEHSPFQYYCESLGDSYQQNLDKIIGDLGQRLTWSEVGEQIDFAFLTLHGKYGEDGEIQRILESKGIPYSGSGVRACEIGIDKVLQKNLMAEAGFSTPEVLSFDIKAWITDQDSILSNINKKLSSKIVVRPSRQGSSIGVSIISNTDEEIKEAIDLAFFKKKISASLWQALSEDEKVSWGKNCCDIRSGLGLPLSIGEQSFYLMEDLIDFLDQSLIHVDDYVELQAHDGENEVMVEDFISGREFSCIVIRGLNGQSIALPPTEIVKEGQLYDYRSKYLPGLSRKETPINLPESEIDKIRHECEKLYEFLGFQTYARIDGFYGHDGTIYLNDPNTTSGMMPSSFFFHQAAEIGLNPSEFLTYIVYTSLIERQLEEGFRTDLQGLIEKLKLELSHDSLNQHKRLSVAVIFGGYSFERHISVESGRNIFEKLSSSDRYQPTPIFLKKVDDGFEFYQVPINLMLKDNADDISGKIDHLGESPILQKIRSESLEVTSFFTSNPPIFKPVKLSINELAKHFEFAFIALHGRPGEDGNLQQILEKAGIPYNGSPPESSRVTINKFDTLQTLKENGFTTTRQFILEKTSYQDNFENTLRKINASFSFPFIVKPVDDGCSSAVKIVKSESDFKNYLTAIFRSGDDLDQELRIALGLGWNEEFPAKNEVLIEELIDSQGAEEFMEITGGLYTSLKADGTLEYHIMEPSEALALGEILSLEEKFLAGEGQNITPARFSSNSWSYQKIAAQVKKDLKTAAQILGVEGYARIDAFVRIFKDGRAETIIIEVNSLPGMTPATCIYHQAALEGMKPIQFIDHIIQFGLRRHGAKILL